MELVREYFEKLREGFVAAAQLSAEKVSQATEVSLNTRIQPRLESLEKRVGELDKSMVYVQHIIKEITNASSKS